MNWKGQICRIGALDIIATAVSHGQNRAVNLSTAGSDSIRSLVQPNRAPLSLTATGQVPQAFCRVFPSRGTP